MKFEIQNMLGTNSADYLYQCLKTVPELRVIKFTNLILTQKDAQAIGKVLSDFKNIIEVDVTNTGLDHDKAKEIADGLMRAKQL